MKVNPTTLLFEDLSSSEARGLLETGQSMIFHGSPPGSGEYYCRLWAHVADPKGEDAAWATRFTERALLSVALHYKSRVDGVSSPYVRLCG